MVSLFMQERPLLSIVTVCYQAENLLAETLNSVMSQTFQSFELVIVDGGSSDKTVSIAEQYHSKIGTLISEKDKGIYDAMNKGIQLAKGDWIYFLNAGDCLYDNQVLEHVFGQTIPEHVGLIYGKIKTVNEPTGVDYVWGKSVSMSDFYFRYPINHQASFARKNAFESIGSFNTRYRLSADNEWFVRFFKQTQFVPMFKDLIIANYDVKGASYTKRMQGYREYLSYGLVHFPFYISFKNYLQYPLLWLKVKVIRIFETNGIFIRYRKLKNKL
jgi:glycosyltransferase involved in cell wall biosynthesis